MVEVADHVLDGLLAALRVQRVLDRLGRFDEVVDVDARAIVEQAPEQTRHVEQQRLARDRHARSLLSRVAENIGNESAPIQLTQCRFPALAISNAKVSIYIFRIEYTKAILSNSTRKLLWFESTTLLMAV